MGAVQTMQPPATGLSTAGPRFEAPSVKVLTPMNRYHKVSDAALEPPKASVLNFCVDGAPTLTQSCQSACQGHERGVHRDHAVRSRHLTAPLSEVTNSSPNAALAAPCTRGSGHPHGTTGRKMAVALLVKGANLTAVGQQQHVLGASLTHEWRERPHVRGMVEDPARRHRHGWRQRHIGPPTRG